MPRKTIRRERLCIQRQNGSKNERDASPLVTQGAAGKNYDPRWSVWGVGLRRLANHQRQCGGRIEQHHQPPVRHGGRRGLFVLAQHCRGLCARRRRHQLQRHRRRQRPLRSVPGRRLRAPHHRRRLSHRRAGLWLAGRDDGSHRNGRRHRSPAAQFNANSFSGRVEAGYRFVSPWIGGIGITPYAAGQFTTFDLPAYAEQVVSGANTFALAYAAKSVTATRSELGLRADKSFAMQDAILTLRGRAAWAHDFNPDSAVGATFQTLPGASFIVNGARQASDSALTRRPPRSNG